MKTLIALLLICQIGLAQTPIGVGNTKIKSYLKDLGYDLKVTREPGVVIAADEELTIKCYMVHGVCFQVIYECQGDVLEFWTKELKRKYKYKQIFSNKYFAKHPMPIVMTTTKTATSSILDFKSVREQGLVDVYKSTKKWK